MKTTSERIDLGHITLRVWAFAPDRAPVGQVLLLHGFLDAGGTWDLCAPTLCAAGYRVLAPDLRGFGESDWVGRGGYYHFPDYVRDVAALCDHQNLTDVHLVGHSMGGTVATLLAGAQPERVGRLAILEGIGPPDIPAAVAVDRFRRWLEDMGKVDDFNRPPKNNEDALKRLSRNHSRVPHDILQSRAKYLTRSVSGKLAWSHDPMHRTTSPSGFSLESFSSFLRAIRCPTLFVGGGPRGFHPPDEDQRISLIPEARRVDLPEAGHMMHWTEPEALCRELLQFFHAGSD